MQQLGEYTIREMTEADLATVLRWRNSDRIRKNMFFDEIITWENHCAWFNRLQENKQMKYFIVELQQRPIGLVNFTEINAKHHTCEWGFYLGETDVPRGSGTALGILGLKVAFDNLNIRKVCAEVFAFNEASLKFHKRLGFAQEGCLSKHVFKNGHYEDIVLFACFSEQWNGIKERLAELFN